MAKPKKSSGPVVQPAPAARVVRGVAFNVARKPEGIFSPVTDALQKIAKSAKSHQVPVWGVFPVYGRDVVIAGYLSARAPRQQEMTWMIEPGGALSKEHLVVEYGHSRGQSVRLHGDELDDIDCVDEFITELAETEAWSELGATPLDARSLPGGEILREPHEAAWWIFTDDGRGADVVLGMTFWRAGDVYRAGRVETWTRPVGDDDAVRVVGVRAARVDRESPLRVAPAQCHYEGETYSLAGDDVTQRREEWLREAERETRAVLDSQRAFGWYFVSDAGG